MPNKRSIVLIALSGVVLSGAALVTLRAAEQASRQPAASSAGSHAGPASASTATRGANASGAGGAATPPPPGPSTTPGHPAPSVPEESATILDDPTTAPDPSQSADKNVSFPSDI